MDFIFEFLFQIVFEFVGEVLSRRAFMAPLECSVEARTVGRGSLSLRRGRLWVLLSDAARAPSPTLW